MNFSTSWLAPPGTVQLRAVHHILLVLGRRPIKTLDRRVESVNVGERRLFQSFLGSGLIQVQCTLQRQIGDPNEAFL